jgi:hypothetical protein
LLIHDLSGASHGAQNALHRDRGERARVKSPSSARDARAAEAADLTFDIGGDLAVGLV